MNILMVLSTNTFPPDERVEREARSLIRDGHHIHLIARRAPGQAAAEEYNGVHVIRVPVPFQKRRLWCDLAYYLVQRYVMVFHILSACRAHNIQAIHCHDLPYALASTLAAWMLNLPLVLDLHEHYTAMLDAAFNTRTYRKFRAFSEMLLGVLRAEERFACRRARHIIVVAREHTPRIVGLGVPAERVLEVTNTPDVPHFLGLPIDPAKMAPYRGEFVILYIGGFDAERGLDTALKAMPRVLEKIPNARLLLIGKGVSEGELRDLTASLGLSARVTFLEFQPFRLLPSFIQFCDVFLVPHISTPLIEMTMPNKIFQPMMLGRCVLVSNTGPMMRVVTDAECGLVFKQGDPVSLAEQIIALRDPDVRRKLGENGQRAVHDRYNWELAVAPLRAVYHALATEVGHAEGGHA